jgi:hypothetical protein
MATNQEKETTASPGQTGETTQSGSPQTRPAGTGTTITIPSMASMMPVAEAFEPKHLLWFGGLAVAGVVGVLEWPVVAAVGIGTYVAERFARSANSR